MEYMLLAYIALLGFFGAQFARLTFAQRATWLQQVTRIPAGEGRSRQLDDRTSRACKLFIKG